MSLKKNLKTFFSFLAIGKTQDSADGAGFKRYLGLASCYVLAVNPTKEEAEKLLGYELKEEPQYVGEDEQGKFVDITFIVRTDPKANGGIEITNRASIRMRPIAAANKDNTKLQVIDEYGNSSWGDKELVDAGGKIEPAQKLSKYSKACVGQCALVDFLKNLLNVPDAYYFKNDHWVLKSADKAAEGVFNLEHIKDYFKGDVTEIREALALQPHNKIKLLYGIKTKDDGSQYQTICTNEQMTLNNAAGIKGYTRLEKNIANAKARGSFANVIYKVAELAEFSLQPTNLEQAPAETAEAPSESDNDMPWDA
jgi:hypothetical protein